MLQPILTTLIFSLSTALLFASTPIILGLLCLIIAFSTAALLASLFSSWFALIALLIYVGGLLVIFAYFLAICPNQLIALKTPFLVFLSTFALFLILAPSHFQTPTLSIPTPLVNIFLPAHTTLLVLLALLLLLTIIVVVKITQRNRGPLRPFN